MSPPPPTLLAHLWDSPLFVSKFIRESSAQVKSPPLFESQLTPHTDYVVAKGGHSSIESEISLSTCGSTNVNLDKYIRVLESYLETLIPYTVPPSDYADIVRAKDPKASPGYPLRNSFSTYADLIARLDGDYEEGGFAVMVDVMNEYESRILKGEPMLSSFQVFSKRDKYTPKKVLEDRYRTIQAGDLFLLFLMQKYYGEYVKLLENIFNKMYLITDHEQYDSKVAPMRLLWCFGVDYTAFDKSETQDLNSRTFRMLGRLCNVPPLIDDFVVDTVCNPMLVMPNGEVSWSGGSNPSGQNLTSVLNTLNHVVHNMVCFEIILSIPPPLYLLGIADANSIMTGDDGVDGCKTRDQAQKLIDELPACLMENFGITAKIDTLDGAPYPRGVLPPYLSNVEVAVAGSYVRVPCRPSRTFGTLQYSYPSDVTSPDFVAKRKERLQGVAVVNAGFSLLSKMDPTYPVPVSYLSLKEELKLYGLKEPSVELLGFTSLEVSRSKEIYVQHSRMTKSKGAKNTSPVSATTTPNQSSDKKLPKAKKKRNKKPPTVVVVENAPFATVKKHVSRPQLVQSIRLDGLTQRQKAAVAVITAQAVFPYEVVDIRIPTGGNSMNLIPTAQARNFLTFDVNLTELLDPTIHVLDKPSIITSSGPVELWQMSNKYFSVIHIHDPYVLGIIPTLREVTPTTPTVLSCSSFDNPIFSNSGGLRMRSGTGVSVVDMPLSEHGRGLWLAPILFNYVSGPQWTAQQPGLDVHQGRVFWVDASPTRVAVVRVDMVTGPQSTLLANSLFLTLILYESDSTLLTEKYREPFPAVAVNTPVGAAFQVQYSGYYAAVLSGNVTNTAVNLDMRLDAVTLSVSTATSIVSNHLLNSQLILTQVVGTSTTTPLVQRVQLNGSALLASNCTAEEGKGGPVYGMCAVGNDSWFTYTSDIQTSVFNSNANIRYEGMWKDGLYGYVRPNKTFQMRDMTDVINSYDGSRVVPRSRVLDPSELDGCMGQNLIVIQPPTAQIGATLQFPQLVKLRFALNLQYVTTSQMVVVRNSPLTSDLTDRAVALLVEVPCFTENPIHVSMMLQAMLHAIGGSAKKAAPWMKTLGVAMSTLGPTASALGGVIAGAGQLFELL